MHLVTFGWFATTPQSGQTFTPTDVHFISTQTWIGAILVVLGLLLMTLWIGVRIGSSTRQRNH